ncbi:inhibitor of KinA sporulation pathway (predicted exonuclease) [Bacillus oleivorans]|uniref:Inhibitor of KinA sporulation pathway (Predicted exonuclease) n=1 Tax=Bacillus oleivorans TaxID=1448271 RepID=A0A285CMD0_9BACI|nr:3'-5' exonuclease [Bacillus oleivorans]SNX68720.1 inhibitor of KinA sporulation pathway (predicted exonuclease) [Bacillus oleivorans]
MADLQQYIFFDFEMLCSNRGMKFEEMEVIRLGAVKYNLQTKEISYFDRYIRPQSHKRLTRFCKELTGISDEDLKNASDFKEVFAEFLYWVGGVKRSQFFSWSKSDLARLKIDAARHGLPPRTIQKIEKRYVDFQAIFSKRVTKTHFSVENAVELYGKKFIGDKHNPMWDAYNTLQIYLCFLNDRLNSDLIMLKQYVFDEIPTDFEKINSGLTKAMKNDISTLYKEGKDLIKMSDAYKFMKKANRLAHKYENIIINRSGIFSKKNVEYARSIGRFYEDLCAAYDIHKKFSSKVMILDEHSVRPLQHLVTIGG